MFTPILLIRAIAIPLVHDAIRFLIDQLLR